jgi:hypothetical protein
MKSVFRPHVLAAILALCMTALGTPAMAQEKSATKDGFTLPPGSAKILLFRPKVRVGAQSTGGMFEPNADWTDQAKQNLVAALASAQSKLGNRIAAADEPVGPAAATLASYRALFATVADAVITYQFFPGNRLPTKKRKGAAFAWSLGSGVTDIPGAADADYILFLDTQDAFGSTGRKVAQIFAAGLGVGITSGVHSGYAGLVDARTGDLVWLNADRQMGGDVREPDGATKRIAQLLEDFPGSVPAKIAAK